MQVQGTLWGQLEEVEEQMDFELLAAEFGTPAAEQEVAEQDQEAAAQLPAQAGSEQMDEPEHAVSKAAAAACMHASSWIRMAHRCAGAPRCAVLLSNHVMLSSAPTLSCCAPCRCAPLQSPTHSTTSSAAPPLMLLPLQRCDHVDDVLSRLSLAPQQVKA